MVTAPWAARPNAVLLRCTCRALFNAIPHVRLSTEEAYGAGWDVLVLNRSRPDYGSHVRQAMARLITTRHPGVPVFMKQFPYVFKYIYADERMAGWFEAAICVNDVHIINILCTHVEYTFSETLHRIMLHRKDLLVTVLDDVRRRTPMLAVQDSTVFYSLRWRYGHGPGMKQWFSDWAKGLLMDPLADTLDDRAIEKRPSKRPRFSVSHSLL